MDCNSYNPKQRSRRGFYKHVPRPQRRGHYACNIRIETAFKELCYRVPTAQLSRLSFFPRADRHDCANGLNVLAITHMTYIIIIYKTALQHLRLRNWASIRAMIVAIYDSKIIYSSSLKRRRPTGMARDASFTDCIELAAAIKYPLCFVVLSRPINNWP